jgi:predicted dehydrogenase
MEIVAVCDVYDKRMNDFVDKIKAAGGDAKAVPDYRDVLAMDEVDYVLIGTPEHWHAQQTLDALDAGKHVYCEKPMTHTVQEALAVLDKASKKKDLKLQVGVQGMSDDSYRAAREAIGEGKIGTVVAAQIEYTRRYGELGPWRRADVKSDDPKPEGLDWKSWLGPAPERPWNPHRYWEWRNYRDYSGGIGTDLFVHRVTRIVRSCGLTMPNRVAGMGGIYIWPDGRNLPDNLELLAEYPPVKGISHGMTLHVLGTMANSYHYDHLIRGYEGTLIFDDKGWHIVDPEGKEIERFNKTGAESVVLHHKNHHAAIRGNAELNCPPEFGLYGFVPVAMANQSWFDKKMLAWDEDQRKVVES